MGFLRGVVNVVNVQIAKGLWGFGMSQFSPLLFCSSLKVSVKKPLLGFPVNYPPHSTWRIHPGGCMVRLIHPHKNKPFTIGQFGSWGPRTPDP